MRPPAECEVVIVGSGPAGTATAIALADTGISACVLDRVRHPRFRIGESLPPKIDPLLTILGVRDEVARAGFVRMAGTSVWRGDGIATHDFDPTGRELGYQVDRAAFDAMLVARAREAGARVFEEFAVHRLLMRGDQPVGVVWRDASGEEGELSASMIVDATGSGAAVARMLGLKRKDSIRTVAFAGYFRHSRLPDAAPASNTLFEMLPDGWIWSVLRRDGLRNVTLGLDAGRLKSRDALPLQLYLDAVRSSSLIGPLLESAELEGELSAHDATWSSSQRYAGSGFLLVGDAASVIDPLTSQGVYKALQSGVVASAVIRTVLERPTDAALALDFYEGSQARFAAGYAAIARTFYVASPYASEPFWEARIRADATDAEAEAQEELRRARREAFTERVAAGGDRVRIRAVPSLSVAPRAGVEQGYVVARPAFVGPDKTVEAGRVMAAALLLLLFDGATVSEVVERYVERTGEARNKSLWRGLMRVLTELAAEGLIHAEDDSGRAASHPR